MRAISAAHSGLLGVFLLTTMAAYGDGPIVGIRVGAFPDEVAVGEGGVWVVNAGNFREEAKGPGTVSRIDPETNRIVATIAVGRRPSAVAVGFGGVWVSNAEDAFVSRIDPGTNRVVAEVSIATEGQKGKYCNSLVAGEGAVWGCAQRTVFKIDPKTNRAEAVHTFDPSSMGDITDLAIGEGSIWALAGWTNANPSERERLYRIDPKTGEVRSTIIVGEYATSVTVGGGAVWVDSGKPGTPHGEVSRIDPKTEAVIATIPVGPYPFDSTFAFGRLWLVELGADRPSLWSLFRPVSGISAIDPATNRVAGRRIVPKFARRIASGAGSVWFTAEDDHTVNRMPPGELGELSKPAPSDRPPSGGRP